MVKERSSFGSVFLLLLVFVQLSASTTQTFEFSKDAYVIKGLAANYGVSTQLQFYTPNALYLEMDISSISTKCPTSAFIKMYSPSSSAMITGKIVKATRIAANWAENTVDGNFNPTKYEFITGSFVSLGSNFYKFDLSNTMLINAINTQSSQLSLYVEETVTTYNLVIFISREGTNSTQRPILSVDYITCDPNAQCTATGCVCNSGYTGDGITCTNGSPCSPNPCLNGGSCSNLGGSYTCNCTGTGYNGTQCQTEINECLSNPCLNGGTCINEINAYTCQCVPGFNGTTCSNNIDDCLPNPCLNGGQCIDGINTYTCNCTGTGFNGARCQTNIDDCSPNPCLNGGTCTDGINSYTCQCIAGYDGTTCNNNIDDCASSPCQNGGSCTDLVNDFKCNCTGTGFNGTKCQTNIDDCLSGPCQNGGTCTDGINAYTCSCVSGYNGPTCNNNIDDCYSGACENGGQCIDGINTYTCDCTGTGFDGSICQNNIDDCEIDSCENGGTCIDGINSFTCQCSSGYNGTTCNNNIDDCFSGACENDGQCVDGVNHYSCNCTGTGFEGSKCDIEINECLSNPCRNYGECVDLTNDYLCNCKNGFSGSSCEIPPTLSPEPEPTTTEPTAAFSNNENNQSTKLGVGIGVGVGLGLILLVLLILFFLRKNKKKGTNTKYLQNETHESFDVEMTHLGDTTLMNTKLEVSMPGFMNIDYLNQIRKEEKIGGGGSAITYKGVILDSKLLEKFEFKEIAIKQMSEDQKFSPEENKIRFEQEISIMWAIHSHPNIITLVGYCENPRCIVTKLYSQDLHQYIKSTTEDISSEIILKLAKDIASGMNMVHSNGIVHRDLKSSNILLEEENNKLSAVICDFGLARISSESNLLNQKIIDLKGFSPRYTAPEVFGRMMTNVTVVSVEDEMKGDVYSYAVIIWELMTRKIPWAHLKEASEIEFQVRSGKREEIPEVQGDETLQLLSTIIQLSWSQISNERPTFQIDQKLSPVASL